MPISVLSIAGAEAVMLAMLAALFSTHTASVRVNLG